MGQQGQQGGGSVELALKSIDENMTAVNSSAFLATVENFDGKDTGDPGQSAASVIE